MSLDGDKPNKLTRAVVFGCSGRKFMINVTGKNVLNASATTNKPNCFQPK